MNKFNWMNFKKTFNLSYLSIIFSLLALIIAITFFVFYASGTGKAHVQTILPKGVLSAAAGIRNKMSDLKYLFYNFPESNISIYKLEISDENLKKLEDSIPDLEARKLSPGYVDGIDERIGDTNRIYVPAKFVADGVEYDVEVRLRGNGPPHWTFPKKSLRVRFPKDNLFEGKRDINFIIPLDRRYLAEQFNAFRAERMDLTVPNSRFVAIEINGDAPALYWEVEHFTKEFLESHNLSGDADLYGEGDTFQQPIYTDVNYWQKYVSDPNKRKDNYSQMHLLLSLLNEAPDDIFYENIFDILDEENFYMWSTHNLLAGSWHQDYSHNARIYFDKSVGKFKFFPWDVYIYDNEDTIQEVILGFEATANPLVERLQSNPEIMRQRNDRLWNYVKNKENLKDELKYYDELFASIQGIFYRDPIRRHSYAFFEQEVLNTRNDIKNNFEQVKYLFENAESSYILENNLESSNLNLELALYKTLSPAYLDELEFKMVDDAKLTAFDVYLDGIKICDGSDAEFDLDKFNVKVKCNRVDLVPDYAKVDTDPDKINHYSFFVYRLKKKKFDFTIVPKSNIDLAEVKEIKISLKNVSTDKNIDEIKGLFVDNTEFTNFYDISRTPQEFVAEYKQFYLNQNNEIVLPGGLYIFSENIIIPRNTKLHILPGAQINLTNNASFISYSSVIAKGTEANKIYVRGEADGKGENFGVLDNLGISEFEYVEFSGGGESTVNGAFFSGMLAIHHADSIIKYSKFENATGDDALNIKYASSTITYNLFSNNSADAIDYDFSDGVIEYNMFVGNGNDGVDISGSSVLVQYNEIINSVDKCISIGEKSTIKVFNNILNGCHIGVEIKDLSSPILMNNVIINNNIGINEYQKKEIFGGGMAKVYNTVIWDNKESITLDSVSTIEVLNSNVEGGYVGEGNINKKPVFNDDFTNNADSTNMSFQTGGNTEILRELLGISFGTAPIGLVTSFTSGI